MEEIKSTVEHLQDLIDAREDMKTSINNKGVQVSGGLKSYADAIDRIPQNVIDGDDLNVGDINVEYTKNGSYNINPIDYELDALSGVGVNINVPTKKVGMNATPIEITKNGVGLYKAKDYSKFDGLSTIAINVDVPTKKLSTASKEYTENGSYTVNASDYNVDGLSQVDVNVDVPTKTIGAPSLPILITNNGSKTIDASDYNVDGLSQVELEINVPQGGGSGGNYEIDFTRIGYSLEESKIANEANVICINNAIKRLDEWMGSVTDYNKWSFVNPDKPDDGNTEFRFSPWNNNNEVIVTPPIYNLNSDGKLVNSSYQTSNRIGVFAYASALRYISYFDTSNVTDMFAMFLRCTSLTAIPKLDTSNVINMDHMFYECTSLTTIPQLDTSNVTDMEWMFGYCDSLTTIPQLDTSNVTKMSNMFDGCTSLTTIPQLDTSNVTKMVAMFDGCTSLTTIPQLDTSNVTNMEWMFSKCDSLTTIPQLDTSNVKDMRRMFQGCDSLTTIPQLNTSKVFFMEGMFFRCDSLTTIPQLDTSNVTDMSNMFFSCDSLTTIPQLDTSNVTDMDEMFYNCKSLENVGGFKGLKADLVLSDCSLLTLDSLENIVNNVSAVTEERTITVNETAFNNWENEDSDRLVNLVEMLIGKGWLLLY